MYISDLFRIESTSERRQAIKLIIESFSNTNLIPNLKYNLGLQECQYYYNEIKNDNSLLAKLTLVKMLYYLLRTQGLKYTVKKATQYLKNHKSS